MYNINETYKKYISTSVVRKPKSKIIVGGTEYTGVTHLKTFPKIEHSTEDAFGSFPAKACEFEIYNVGGNIKLNGKEVSMYRGLVVDGDTIWIPMGIFKAENEDIISNLTTKTIKFKGSDRSHLFDVAFNSTLHTYPCKLLAFVKQLCTNHSIVLENEDFPFYDLELEKAPEFAEGITEREIIRKIAQLGGCIAQITRDGKLKISQPEVADIPITSGKYSSLSRENTIYVTGVTLSQAESEDLTVNDSTYVGAYGEFVYKINDNPFIKDRRSEVIDSIARYYLGRNITPFVLNGFIDDFIYDLNDLITVRDKSGAEFTTPLLGITTQSRIKCDLKTEVQKEKRSSDGDLEGSVKQYIAESKKQIKEAEKFVNNFNERLLVGLQQGSYRKVIKNDDGSEVTYYFNAPEIENATYIFHFGANGFAYAKGSGCWNGGNPVWSYGVNSEGDAILENLLLRTLTADLIRAGRLESVDGNTYFDLEGDEIGTMMKDQEGNTTHSVEISPLGVNIESDYILSSENPTLTEAEENDLKKLLEKKGYKEGTMGYFIAHELLSALYLSTKTQYGVNIKGTDEDGNKFKSNHSAKHFSIEKTSENVTVKTEFTSDGITSDGPQTFKAPELYFEGDIYLNGRLTGNKLLWEGESHMNTGAWCDLAEPIFKQPNGIVLVFAPYNGTEYQDEDFATHFVSKYEVKIKSGKSFTFPLFQTKFGCPATKSIYINDYQLNGHGDNVVSGTNNGITYNNSGWALRYVIGV